MAVHRRTRPVHYASKQSGQEGFAVCGVKLSRVDHADEMHFVTCGVCRSRGEQHGS